MWTTLTFGGNSKTERRGRRYFQRNSRYLIWTRLVNWFRRYVYVTDRKLKTIFRVSGIFPGNGDSVILLGFDCSINPQNFNKIVGTFFRKSKCLIFSLCELPLILGLGILKKSLEIFATVTHTHTQTHTFFQTTFFRMWEWYRIENHQKIKVEFLDYCNPSFTPNVARK